MISERLALMLEEAERRVSLKPVNCMGDPDYMSPEAIDWVIKRERDNMILNEMTKMLRNLP